VLGLFAPNHMPYAIDKSDAPSLADMLAAALAVLRAKSKPFVLFVEGSRIDHALHDNDAAAAAAEVLAYDDAVKVGLLLLLWLLLLLLLLLLFLLLLLLLLLLQLASHAYSGCCAFCRG